ncbi:MAG: PEP-CTERM sorting domain-containing protein [Phycisphaerae bacterium]|nr:PEP-CTERM sorting domain-containing protein [Phycisphaerae bacterium]
MKRILSVLIISLFFLPLSSAPADINSGTVPSGKNLSIQVDPKADDSDGSFAQASVPEPGALTLLIIGGIGVLARHKRRRSR